MILPSIASANPLALGAAIDSLGDHPRLHIDIEDGNFIPNITFGLKTVRAIRNHRPDLSLDAHIMATNPAHYLEALAGLGVREIALHLESMPYPLALLNRARTLGMTPGLALNFATPVRAVLPFVREMDFLLLMTAEPDDRGERFHPGAPERITEAAALLRPEKGIWVDGGIGEAELPVVREAGATAVVMGRAVFGAPDPGAELARLSRIGGW